MAGATHPPRLPRARELFSSAHAAGGSDGGGGSARCAREGAPVAERQLGNPMQAGRCCKREEVQSNPVTRGGSDAIYARGGEAAAR